MKPLTIFYLFLYISHIIFGPYYFWYFFTNTPFKWISNDFSEILRRSTWITYVGFLLIALFNEYPNAETFLVAAVVSVLATLGYFKKFEDSEEYIKGTVDHLLILIAPLCILFFYYEIKISSYKPTYLSLVVLIYIVIMKYSDHILYVSGIDI